MEEVLSQASLVAVRLLLLLLLFLFFFVFFSYLPFFLSIDVADEEQQNEVVERLFFSSYLS